MRSANNPTQGEAAVWGENSYKQVMRFDTDTYREILDALTRNKRRSFLTGFGIFWGLFMLLFLIGGGNGLKQLLEKNFEGFATNTVIIAAELELSTQRHRTVEGHGARTGGRYPVAA